MASALLVISVHDKFLCIRKDKQVKDAEAHGMSLKTQRVIYISSYAFIRTILQNLRIIKFR
jgi:hypothetical protein